MSSSGMGRDVHSTMDRPAFRLPTMASPTLQGALNDGFGEAVAACDMPEPFKRSSSGIPDHLCYFIFFITVAQRR